MEQSTIFMIILTIFRRIKNKSIWWVKEVYKYYIRKQDQEKQDWE